MADFWHRLQFATTLHHILTRHSISTQHIYHSCFNIRFSHDGSSNPILIMTAWVDASISETKGCRKVTETLCLHSNRRWINSEGNTGAKLSLSLETSVFHSSYLSVSNTRFNHILHFTCPSRSTLTLAWTSKDAFTCLIWSTALKHTVKETPLGLCAGVPLQLKRLRSALLSGNRRFWHGLRHLLSSSFSVTVCGACMRRQHLWLALRPCCVHWFPPYWATDQAEPWNGPDKNTYPTHKHANTHMNSSF